MKPSQLRKLIQEVIREVESEKKEFGSHSAAHEKEYGGLRDSVLSLKLGGINKNNTHIVKDFIAQAAHAAKMADLEILHAELEQGGKIGMSVDEPEIKSAERSVEKKKQKETPLPKGWRKTPPNPADWNRMSPEERADYLIPGSHSDEWEKATAADMAAAKGRASADKGTKGTKGVTADTNAKKDMGSYNFGRGIKLPKNINLWGDNEWRTWETLPVGDKRMVKFMIPNMEPETWTDNDWKAWEKLNPLGQKKVQFNIPRYEPER